MNGEVKAGGKGCEGRVGIYLKGAGSRYSEGKQIVYSSNVQQKDKKELCKLCAAHNNAVGPYIIIRSRHIRMIRCLADISHRPTYAAISKVLYVFVTCPYAFCYLASAWEVR